MENNHRVSPSAFFILTIFLSWSIWIPLDFSHFGIGQFQIPESLSQIIRLLGVLMPAISALCLVRIKEGKCGLSNLLGGFKRKPIDWYWWAAAFLLQPGLLVFAGIFNNLIPSGERIAAVPGSPFVTILINTIFLLLATLGEEIGWRGFALPALQERHSAFKSSLILGLVWMAWHLPFWLLLDTFDQFGWAYVGMNLLMGIPVTFIITWFFNHGNQSLWLPVGFHLVFNLINNLWLPVTLNIRAFWIFIALEWILALMVVRKLSPDETRLVNQQV
jgi:membrane protease YdiL (CAAX protease family)